MIPEIKVGKKIICKFLSIFKKIRQNKQKTKKNLHFMIEKEKNDLTIPIIPSLTID